MPKHDETSAALLPSGGLLSLSHRLRFTRLPRVSPPFLRMKNFLPLLLALLSVAAVPAARSEPLGVLDSASIRPDGKLAWSAFSSINGFPVPEGTTLATTNPGVTFTASATESFLSIFNSPYFYTPGILLRSLGPGKVTLTASRNLQAFGIVVEHPNAVLPTYELEFFDQAGVSLGIVSASPPGGNGDPQFIGLVDPAARIRSIRISAAPENNTLALGEPVFTVPAGTGDNLALLPVDSQVQVTVDAHATYLHRGLRPPLPVPPTADATAVAQPGHNVNAFDLQAKFPTIAAGDIRRCERQGIALKDGFINNLAGVFTRTPEIGDGRELQRLPTAIAAGTPVYTPFIGGSFGSIETPTNISEDFQIGVSTFTSLPAGGRYLMLSFTSPGASGPVGLLISHIRRQPFLDWVASLGLHGSLADPAGDLDGDGLSLLEEFAFRKDPTASDNGGPGDFAFAPRPRRNEGGGLSLTFGARMNAGLGYQAEFSSNLKDWLPAAESSTVPALIGPQGDRAVFTILDPLDGGGAPARFGRLIITSSAPR